SAKAIERPARVASPLSTLTSTVDPASRKVTERRSTLTVKSGSRADPCRTAPTGVDRRRSGSREPQSTGASHSPRPALLQAEIDLTVWVHRLPSSLTRNEKPALRSA